MALQQFVEQINAKQPAPAQPDNRLPNPSKVVGKERTAPMHNMEAASVSPLARTSVGPGQQQPSDKKVQTSNGTKALTASATSNEATGRNPFTSEQQKMLCSTAALQIKYGRPAEAIPYLMMVRKVDPKDADCVRLLALCFMRLKRWQEADAMVSEYEALLSQSKPSQNQGMLFLYKSIVAFKNKRTVDARNFFNKFRSFVKSKLIGSTS